MELSETEAKLREIEPYWPSLSMEIAESINRVILGEDTQDELEQLSERISRIRRAKYEKNRSLRSMIFFLAVVLIIPILCFTLYLQVQTWRTMKHNLQRELEGRAEYCQSHAGDGHR